VTKFLAVLLSAWALAGCNRSQTPKPEAVRQAIIDHLGTRAGLNLNSMKIDVTNVEYKGTTEAVATVSFAPKGSEGGGMSMRYHLVRDGNRWIVKGKSDSGSSPHGTMPAAPSTPPAGSDLPPGHPPVKK
jgi:hypothetical protein